MDECIFCKIIKKEIPAKIIWEDQNNIAFLDIYPSLKGQTLVIPKIHEDYVFNLEDKTYSNLMLAAKKVAEKMKQALNCERVCVKIEGFEVPHVHIKLYPTNTVSDLKEEIYKASEEELEESFKELTINN